MIFVDGKCPVCEGTGVTGGPISKYLCHNCNGTGSVGHCYSAPKGSLSSYLSSVREKTGMTIEQVSQALNMSPSRYRDIEAGISHPFRQEVDKLAKWVDKHIVNREIYPDLYVKHFKRETLENPGKKYLYKILKFAVSADDGKELVIYQALEDDKIYSRPKDEFLSLVDREKYPNIKQLYRFEVCNPEDFPVEKLFTCYDVAKLRKIRERSKISMADLAKDLNCSVAHISDLELGKVQPTEEELEYIKKFVRKHIQDAIKAKCEECESCVEDINEALGDMEDEEEDMTPYLMGRVERLQNTCLILLRDLVEATGQHPGYLFEKYGLTDLIMMAMDDDEDDECCDCCENCENKEE